MNISNRFSWMKGGFVATVLAVPMMVNCSSTLTNPAGALCCTEFKVGADMSQVDFGVDASVKGQFAAFAQASGDLSAVATGALDDVTNACRNIAIDLNASQADRDAANAKNGADGVKAWCALAVKAMGDVKGKLTAAGVGKLEITFTPPKCEASISAKAKCQASCSVDGKCDIKANPPKCTGGKLTVECKGECTAEAGAKVACEGSCTGNCEGSCQAQGGVRCAGKCEGECTAEGSANGQAFDAKGNCQGTCKGTCSVTPPSVQCTGTCHGSCSASCKASATASVKSDGKCAGDFQPLSCEGGKLEGGCTVDAKCDANCDASVSAKAECTPPELTISASGSATLTGDVQAQYNILIDTLKVNLPNILVVAKARGQALVSLAGTVSGNASVAFDPGKLGVKGSACAVGVIATLVQASGNIEATVTASASVTGAAGI